MCEEARRSRARRPGLSAAEKVGSYDVRSGDIDQIPGVHVESILQVEVEDALFVGLVCSIVAPDQYNQSCQTLLVDGAVQQVGNVLKDEVSVAPRNSSNRRDPHPEEDVALTVPTWPGLEEPL